LTDSKIIALDSEEQTKQGRKKKGVKTQKQRNFIAHFFKGYDAQLFSFSFCSFQAAAYSKLTDSKSARIEKLTTKQ